MRRANYERLDFWRFAGAAVLVGVAVFVAIRSTWLLEQSIGSAGSESNYGYRPDPAATREFLAQLEQPTFRQAGAEVIAGAKGQDAYLYRFADKAHRKVYGTPYGPWNQGQIGTCVSFGWGMGSYIGQCVDWANGQLPEAPFLVATEPIYGGSRTEGRLPPVKFAGYSDGSYGAAAARWVSGLKNGHGGILFRQKYGDVDLTTYSIPRSKDWGAYGVPANLAAEANKHTARAVALCETWEGLTAALESGMCVPVCSNVGFAATSVRDADGFLPRGGSWGHCMVACSVKYAKNNPDMKKPRDGVLIMNSWGASWCSGPKHPADQPDGSFWITKEDAVAILKQGDSFVIGSVEGFKYRDLNNGGWLAPVPVESITEVQE